ncbi:transporter [Labilibaculum sp.]|uniref:transporter n=1 Tax=Labilibaculum sp. TaxID=2060723 RepID=UPI0035639DFA
MRQSVTLLLFVILFFGGASAQEKPDMVTDRPDQTESASLISPKGLQIESGFAFEKTDADINNTTFNTTLLRYGLVDNIELRMGFSYQGIHSSEEEDSYTERGFGPLSIGAKFHLLEDEGKPKLALLTTISIPHSGSSTFENENLGADIRVTGDYFLNEAMSLGMNLGVAWSGVEDEDYAVGVYTAVVGISLSQKLGAFAELYGFLPNEGKNDHRWDAGMTYSVNDDLQLDFSTGIGLSEVSPDFFLSLGLSIRMPL